MGNRVLVEAAAGPAVFALLAVFNALACHGVAWRERLSGLIRDLRDCVVAAVLLGSLAAVLHGLGIESGVDVACLPSPNGRICEDE